MALNLVGTSGNATIDANTGISGLSIDFPTWTTGTRPSSPAVGQTGYNSTLSSLETWTGSVWTGGLPTQSGNAGKYLTTDGSTASWADLIFILDVLLFLLVTMELQHTLLRLLEILQYRLLL